MRRGRPGSIESCTATTMKSSLLILMGGNIQTLLLLQRTAGYSLFWSNLLCLLHNLVTIHQVTSVFFILPEPIRTKCWLLKCKCTCTREKIYEQSLPMGCKCSVSYNDVELRLCLFFLSACFLSDPLKSGPTLTSLNQLEECSCDRPTLLLINCDCRTVDDY
jgi:hypothetical protein